MNLIMPDDGQGPPRPAMPPASSQAIFHERERLTLGEWRQQAAGRLLGQLQRVARGSDFYARKWSASQSAEVARNGSLDVAQLLESLPVTEKDELRESQERRPPFGEHLVCGADEVVRVHRTSGTTGRPLIIALSERDARVTQSHGAQAFFCAGLRPHDIVVHCLSYSMWSGGLTDHLCLEGAGAAVVPFGVGNTASLIELPQWVPFTVVSCTPSYVSLLLEELGDGPRRELWARSVRLFLVGGEPGGSNPGLRRAATDSLGAHMANANYGLAEVLSIFGSECPATGAMHFHGQDALWVEIVDPKTHRPLELADGAVGEVLLTHLDREAQPLVRYRTNDLVRITSVDPCACGRSGFQFEVLGRADDMFMVRGINVFPSAIAQVLSQVPPGLREFLVVLPNTPTFDTIPLRVEAPADIADPGRLAVEIARALKIAFGCSATVDVVPKGSLSRSEGKTPRVVRAGGAATQ